jgi:G:T/U-mismatch repair DNA glycosylase
MIIDCLTANHIAIYDTACEIRRTKNTASDKDLEIITATDIDALLQKMPECEAVVTTGQKATDTFVDHFDMDQPKVGGFSEFHFERRTLRLYRMPSSSRAYPMKVEQKAGYYQNMFNDIILSS